MAATNRSWRARPSADNGSARRPGTIGHHERLRVGRPVPGDAASDPDRTIPGSAGAEDRWRRPRPIRRRRSEARDPGPQRPERRRGGLDRPIRVLELARVARGQGQVAQRERIDAALHQLGDALEVARRLGHLLAVHQQELAVDPGPGRRPADDRRRLGDLVLVVREDVVDAAGVDVELRAEIAHRHRRALDVPAGEALAPAVARPLQQTARPGRLPEREVGRIALVGLDVAAMAGAQVSQRVARQPAVAVEPADVVVDVPVRCGVGVAEVLERLGQRQHLGDVIGRAREDVGGQDVDRGLVGMERGFVRVGDLGRRLVLQAGGHQHRVLAAVEALVAQVADVGDVLDVEDVDAVVQEGPPDQVGEQIAAQVPDVRVAVDGRATGVHPDPAAFERLDLFDPAGEGIAEPESHAVHAIRRFRDSADRWPLTVPRKPRYPIRGLAVPIPSFPRRCGSARPHLVPGRRPEAVPGPRSRPDLYSARCADSSPSSRLRRCSSPARGRPARAPTSRSGS